MFSLEVWQVFEQLALELLARIFLVHLFCLIQVRHGQDLGIPKQDGGVLVGFIAMSETIGKIVFGRIADHPRVNRIYLYQMCMLVCSVLTTLLPVLTSYKSLLAYCILFGIHDGGFVVLIAVLVGDVVGKEKMASAYGIMYCISGIPMILGPPIAGKCGFVGATDNYTKLNRSDPITVRLRLFSQEEPWEMV